MSLPFRMWSRGAIALAASAWLANPAAAQDPAPAKWVLVRGAEGTADLRGFDPTAAAGILNAAKQLSDPAQATQRLFQLNGGLSFHEVDKLVKSKVLDGSMSDILGRGRRQMIDAAMRVTIEQLAKASLWIELEPDDITAVGNVSLSHYQASSPTGSPVSTSLWTFLAVTA